MRRRKLLTLAGASAVGQLLTACLGSPAPSAGPSSIAPSGGVTAPAAGGGTPSGTIAVYSALADEVNDQLLDAFRKSHPGIAVDVLSLAPAGELQTRIRVERTARKADLFVGGDSSLHDLLAREGLLERYVSPSVSAVLAEARDHDGFWTGWYLTLLVTAVNTRRLADAAGGKVPATWDDLLDPVWKGKLLLPDPAKTSAGYAFLAVQAFRHAKDDARTMDYMKELDPNVAQYVGSESRGLDLLSDGSSACCVAWSHDVMRRTATDRALDLAVPESTGLGIGAVSIIKGTVNDLAARTFVDWTLTKDAAELNVRLNKVFPIRGDVAVPPGAPALDSVKRVSYDRAWADDQHDRLVGEWREAVRR